MQYLAPDRSLCHATAILCIVFPRPGWREDAPDADRSTAGCNQTDDLIPTTATRVHDDGDDGH